MHQPSYTVYLCKGGLGIQSDLSSLSYQHVCYLMSLVETTTRTVWCLSKQWNYTFYCSIHDSHMMICWHCFWSPWLLLTLSIVNVYPSPGACNMCNDIERCVCRWCFGVNLNVLISRYRRRDFIAYGVRCMWPVNVIWYYQKRFVVQVFQFRYQWRLLPS